MAGGLKRTLPLRAAVAAALAACLAAGSVASPAPAEAPLPDPTRPPQALEAAPAATEAKAGAAAGLQTVILRKGRKPVAVINGETVELGSKLGEATLIKLSDREAVLQGPQGREVLRLTPKAEKRPADKDAAAGEGKR